MAWFTRRYHIQLHCETEMCRMLTHWPLVMSWNLVNIGPGNGLVPHSTKQLPDSMPIRWFTLNWILRDKLQCNFDKKLYAFNNENANEGVICKVATILFRPQCLKKYENEFLPSVVLEIMVNTDWGNGLLPDGTKPLPQPVLT